MENKTIEKEIVNRDRDILKLNSKGYIRIKTKQPKLEKGT